MSRQASRSPSQGLWMGAEQEARRGGRMRGRRGPGGGSGRRHSNCSDEGAGDNDHWGSNGRAGSRENSISPPALRPRSRSRSDLAPPAPARRHHHRRRRHRGAEDALGPPEDEEPLGDSAPPRRGGGERRGGGTRHPRDQDRDHDRDGQKGRDKRRGKDRDRRPDPRAMMQGMMGMNPMMMGMMGGMGMGMPPFFNPAAMPGVPPPPPPPPIPGKKEAKKEAKKDAKKDGSDSSSSSDSSSDSSDDAPGMLASNPAMAAMAAMWGGAAAQAAAARSSYGAMFPAGNVEAFLAGYAVDPDAADRLRALPPHLQQVVIQRGPLDLNDSRNPSTVLIARIREAEMRGNDGPRPFNNRSGPGGRNGDREDQKKARTSAKVVIEAMISDYRLPVSVAWTLRALSPNQQKLAARIDPAGQVDPAGYVAEQLKDIV